MVLDTSGAQVGFRFHEVDLGNLAEYDMHFTMPHKHRHMGGRRQKAKPVSLNPKL